MRGAPSRDRPDQRASPQAGGYGPRGTLSEAPFSARRVAPEQKSTLCDDAGDGEAEGFPRRVRSLRRTDA